MILFLEDGGALPSAVNVSLDFWKCLSFQGHLSRALALNFAEAQEAPGFSLDQLFDLDQLFTSIIFQIDVYDTK